MLTLAQKEVRAAANQRRESEEFWPMRGLQSSHNELPSVPDFKSLQQLLMMKAWWRQRHNSNDDSSLDTKLIIQDALSIISFLPVGNLGKSVLLEGLEMDPESKGTLHQRQWRVCVFLPSELKLKEINWKLSCTGKTMNIAFFIVRLLYPSSETYFVYWIQIEYRGDRNKSKKSTSLQTFSLCSGRFCRIE